MVCLLALLATTLIARPPNYDESKVAPYTLPDPLTFMDGTKLTSPAQWPKRRAEILSIFEDQMYGLIPGSGDAALHPGLGARTSGTSFFIKTF
jgi:hypothetical protein